ncbi:glycosyltransferase family 4 protein [Vibrio paucivorans]|uniref:Glycosyltransferase family 4 protein n=1 Tax=Vibrio paucivorans TaxID=2829489 RepID=A0A9X3HQ31_9VIBR|nr:glycosyltransferase family 4 protein [Vibrio paucivorans]MCW8332994.1 glycosyltransferase family 4 protein [Vibrio paucivorans]
MKPQRADTNSPHSVWLLIDSLTYGGIETHVLELAKGLQAHQVATTVVFVAHYQTTPLLQTKLEHNGIPHFYLDQSFPARSALHSLKLAIDTHKPALVHAHGYKASLYSRLIKYVSKSRFTQVSTYHAGETPKGKVWLYDFIDRYSASFSDACLAVSALIQNKLPSRSYMVNNFVSLDDNHQQHGEQIAFVGRLSHEKAPDRFMDLALKFPSQTFHCYGSGPMVAQLEQNKSDNLILEGHQNDMNQVWAKIGLLVISSRYEGLPMAALEAMARGIPVIAMNVGQLPTLISHQNNGYLADSPQSLEQSLNDWLASSPTQQAHMRSLAKQTVEQQYSPQSVIPQLLSIYQI